MGVQAGFSTDCNRLSDDQCALLRSGRERALLGASDTNVLADERVESADGPDYRAAGGKPAEVVDRRGAAAGNGAGRRGTRPEKLEKGRSQ